MEVPVFIFTRIASTEGFLAAIAIVIGALILKKKARSVVALLASTTGLILSVQATKELLRVPRPDAPIIDITGYAFPSGHAAGMAFLAFVLMYLARKLPTPYRYAVWCIGISSIVIVGLSRIYFGVHTDLQVLAGYLFGAFWAGIFIWLSKSQKRNL